MLVMVLGVHVDRSVAVGAGCVRCGWKLREHMMVGVQVGIGLGCLGV